MSAIEGKDGPGYNDASQDAPAWVAWAQQQRIDARVDRLFTRTLARIPAEPWWDPAVFSGRELPPPMPECGRFEPAMLHWMEDVADLFFPTEEALADSGNFEAADQFVAWIGECFVRHADGVWFNEPANGAPIYSDIGPSLCFGFTLDVINPVDLLMDAVAFDPDDPYGSPGFGLIASEVYSYQHEYARDAGIPHEMDEVLRQHHLA